jgi:tRNA(Ile2) C34 agmatinyltransferase TiaS
VRYLPITRIRAPLLAEVIQGAADDPRGRTLCGWCGTRMRIGPGPAGREARCPCCARQQRGADKEELPWRLDPASAEALRRTRRWLRRL